MAVCVCAKVTFSPLGRIRIRLELGRYKLGVVAADGVAIERCSRPRRPFRSRLLFPPGQHAAVLLHVKTGYYDPIPPLFRAFAPSSLTNLFSPVRQKARLVKSTVQEHVAEEKDRKDKEKKKKAPKRDLG